jgi:hypothetical protein
MTATLFVAACALTAVFALLTQCASDLAVEISTGYALLLIGLCAGIHVAGRHER